MHVSTAKYVQDRSDISGNAASMGEPKIDQPVETRQEVISVCLQASTS